MFWVSLFVLNYPYSSLLHAPEIGNGARTPAVAFFLWPRLVVKEHEVVAQPPVVFADAVITDEFIVPTVLGV